MEVEQLFIIGGGQIYQETIAICDVLEITEVEAEPEGDTFFSGNRPENLEGSEAGKFCGRRKE
ncbi:dihydrofolate reductase [Algoriphagus boritolerans]|uniref:dihydrofolate reductase n=1 Tax=Algoriphagus boritolerans TaxID=308111 RepID=UPI000B230367